MKNMVLAKFGNVVHIMWTKKWMYIELQGNAINFKGICNKCLYLKMYIVWLFFSYGWGVW